MDSAKEVATLAQMERVVLMTARACASLASRAPLKEGQKQKRKRVPIMANVPLCREVPRARSPLPLPASAASPKA